MNESKKFLIAPLNWGLGHATRCIPIIRYLLQKNVQLFLASDGRAYHLLQKEFPQLPIFKLPSYNITYHSSNMYFNMARQFPKMLTAISKEKKAIQKIVEREKIDVIISDNRYGCRTAQTYNVFITHQINLPIPMPVAGGIANAWNRSYIQQFDECWVPDFEGTTNLSGQLSHGHFSKRRLNVHYLGVLSRLKKIDQPIRRKAIVILSGPEPQRTYLENLILEQAIDLPDQFLVVKGQTERKEHYYFSENIEVVSFLTARELNQAIAESGIVISRAGYTTLMDLVFLGKKAILIPTPGQTEQIYLADHFAQQEIFYSVLQKDFHLKTALEKVQQYTGFEIESLEQPGFQKIVNRLLEK